MSNVVNKKRKLSIYGCGGTGCNIIQDVLNIPEAAGFPIVNPYRVDTSSSNIVVDKSLPDPYLVAGVSGSGKKRSFAHKIVAPLINDILLECIPGDFNVVVFGLGGGTTVA